MMVASTQGKLDFVNSIDKSSVRASLQHIQWKVLGKVTDVVGTVIEAYMPGMRLGMLVDISIPQSKQIILAEVVGFRDEKALLLPFSNISGISPGSTISRHPILEKVPVGDFLLGRVFDPFLHCLSHAHVKVPEHSQHWDLDRLPDNPMQRERVAKPLGLGIRAIDALLSFGDGQRVGIMAGSGVGKSVLMGMIARGSDADINVIGLIGERGREVREFIEKDLGEEGLKRSVVIAVTGDQSPLMKVRAAKVVTSISEYFSARGLRVLMMMDSLTRVAMAQREIGLAVGEPPTTKGYTPSVFSLLPRLLERTGPQRKGYGSISAMYTVLVDGDDFNEPIADAARSILDGQYNLTRRLASRGHYPAIDIGSSVSRVMVDIVNDGHRGLAMQIKNLLAVYEENVDLVQIGAYQPGTNPTLDRALRMMPAIERFLRQDVKERSTYATAIADLQKLLSDDQGVETEA